MAFTMVEIMIVVAIIGLLGAIAIPNFVKAREYSQLNAIINNLRIIEGAKDVWALENKKGTGSKPEVSDIAPFLKGHIFPPASVVGETYLINRIGISATAKISVRLGKYPAGEFVRLP